MNETIEQLEEELEKMKILHHEMWADYGSELCSGDMIQQEKKLEDEINKLKNGASEDAETTCVKYTHIEYTDLDDETHKRKIDKVFWLAVIPPDKCSKIQCDNGYFGINVGISIPHEDAADEKTFYDSIFGNTAFKTDGMITAYLLGINGERVPIRIGEANGYDQSVGTSCIFGYFSPIILAQDDNPKISSFGSIKKELNYR